MFDLNEKKFGGTVIFNNGDSGVVKNVDISIEKKKQEDPDTYPDYKLVANDGVSTISNGFYYPKTMADKTTTENEKREILDVSRVMHVAKAVLGENYSFPTVNSGKEAFDVLFPLINEHAKNKKFNVFTTYGSPMYPKKYLELRYFNFIESADVSPSRLFPSKNDLLVRLTEDAVAEGTSTTQNWGS
jgi:hypothetical protein